MQGRANVQVALTLVSFPFLSNIENVNSIDFVLAAPEICGKLNRMGDNALFVKKSSLCTHKHE